MCIRDRVTVAPGLSLPGKYELVNKSTRTFLNRTDYDATCQFRSKMRYRSHRLFGCLPYEQGYISHEQDRREGEPLDGVTEMRTIAEVDLNIRARERVRGRHGRNGSQVGLALFQVDGQQWIRNLLLNARDVDAEPLVQARTVGRQGRIGG